MSTQSKSGTSTFHGDMLQISMEMDPGTFDLNKAKAFKEMGVTRASMGVQSFNEELLKNAGRGHSVEVSCRGVRCICAQSFPLIFCFWMRLSC